MKDWDSTSPGFGLKMAPNPGSEPMRHYRIAVIPGDGIGREVVPEGLRVLDRAAALSEGALSLEYSFFPWGSEFYRAHGRMMPVQPASWLPGRAISDMWRFPIVAERSRIQFSYTGLKPAAGMNSSVISNSFPDFQNPM